MIIPLIPAGPGTIEVALATVGKVKGALVGRAKLIRHVWLLQLGVPIKNPWFITLRKSKSLPREGLKISVNGVQSVLVPVWPLCTSWKELPSFALLIVPLLLNVTRHSVGVAAFVRFPQKYICPVAMLLRAKNTQVPVFRTHNSLPPAEPSGRLHN